MQERINHILRKGKAESAKEADRQEMLSLFHQAENEYELKNNLLEELFNCEVPETNAVDFKEIFEKLWAKIERTNKQSKSKIRHLSVFVKVAAAVVIGLFIGVYVTSLKTNHEPVYYAAHSPRGSVSEMVLPDGSVIFLNSDSKIKYSINGEKGIREVFLNGEAYFEVEKNQKKPFVVHTLLYDVNVTGTKFNVKAYETENDLTTTLEKGQVIIHSPEKFKFAENIILKSGEQAILNKDSKKLTIKKVNTKWFTSWKDNKLIFVNVKMKEFIVILERRYGVDIETKDSSILNLHVDCTLKNESILEILKVIKKTLPVNYKIEGQKIEITKK